MHQKGWIDFGVAMLLNMHINHPGDGCPLQPGRQSLEDVETGAGYLDPALEINEVQRWPQVPVG